ncbi:MAG TPA: D-TA family PLP-dependent enzyme [Mucilaginibacter sp.]|nr:D-TA family PLP-dependent enzyme [Mucilaginibacter sp.]
MDHNDWYSISDVESLDSPALVIYRERVKENIRLLTGMIDDVSRLRPHVKTNKCVEAVQLMLDAGITKFKCATIAEAEMLGMCKAPDALLAYQPAGPKLGRLIKLIKTYPDTKYSCLVDNITSATNISETAVQNGLQIDVYIDLNVGQNRTGIIPGDALQLYIDCQSLDGIKLIGLHAYDGHLHEADLQARTIACNLAYEPVAQLQREIVAKNLPEPIIVAGGSPTFPIHAKREKIECSPGTLIYWDRGYSIVCAEQPFSPAALVISRVISLPDKTKVCLDVGHKSVSAENDLSKRIYFINAPELKMISQSEEHLVCEAVEGHQYKVGDVLYGMPYHVCPTIALYERAITIENHKITGEWKNIARDRKINI